MCVCVSPGVRGREGGGGGGEVRLYKHAPVGAHSVSRAYSISTAHCIYTANRHGQYHLGWLPFLLFFIFLVPISHTQIVLFDDKSNDGVGSVTLWDTFIVI